jgi:hypothetical protein
VPSNSVSGSPGNQINFKKSAPTRCAATAS